MALVKKLVLFLIYIAAGILFDRYDYYFLAVILVSVASIFLYNVFEEERIKGYKYEPKIYNRFTVRKEALNQTDLDYVTEALNLFYKEYPDWVINNIRIMDCEHDSNNIRHGVLVVIDFCMAPIFNEEYRCYISYIEKENANA